MHEIEIAINLFLQALGNFLTLPMQALSFLGTEEFFLLMLSALYWCFDALLGIRISLLLLATNGLNALFKLVFAAPRPFWFDARVQALSSEASFGLPSGHAQTAASVWGLLATAVRARWVKVIAILLILLIGISRIYLGMHFATDVLAGWLIGLLVLWLYLRLEKPTIAWLKPKSLFYQLGIGLITSLGLIAAGLILRAFLSGWQPPAEWVANATADIPNYEFKPLSLDGIFSTAGIWLGATGGLAWYYRRYGIFRVRGTPLKLLIRYLLGAAGVILFWFGLGQVLPRSEDFLGYSLRFLRYALVGVWVVALAPLVFSRLGLVETPKGKKRH